jgi:hypothetical protein
MVKQILFWLLFLNLNLVQAKQAYESEQEVFNRVAIETDTVFIGRVLRVKTIKGGLVYANGDTLPIGITEEEVLKVYRGKIAKGDKLLVCTWFNEIEYPFGPSIGNESIIFGIKVDNRVLLPSLYGYTRGVPEKESSIYKALKLKRKNIKDKTNILATYFSDSKITHNACNEPVTWP